MTDIYTIEYSKDDVRYMIAILEDRALVNSFMTNLPWKVCRNGDWCLEFKATHYKKDPSGILQLIGVLDYSKERPPQPPLRIRIPRD